jgi:hypothetical protein
MASPRTRLQHFDTPLLQQNTLDGRLRLLMLPRFSRPNRATERVSFELDNAANK